MATLKLVSAVIFRSLYIIPLLIGIASACEEPASPLMLSGLGVCSRGIPQHSGINGSCNDLSFRDSIDAHSNLPVMEQMVEMSSETSVYYVKQAPGKGLGAFAKHRLPRGTPILVEEPLFSVPMPEMVPGQGFKILDMIASIEAEFGELLPDQKEEFLDLHEFHFPSEESPNKLMTIFRSNAYNTGDNHVGIFPKIARINHSCKPNSGNWWSEMTDQRVIYASRDIEKDEEITVSYIPLLKTTKDRQARLQQYGFTCDCSACNSLESDKRRVRISDSMDDLEQKQDSPSKKASINEKRISKAVKLVEMIEAEGLSDYLDRAYHLAAVFNQQAGDLREAIKWATKEWEILAMAEMDSAEALKALNFIQLLNAEST
ncbi:SET domain-containing protein [Lachnellula suecica]|uniref:SET domain-containing protein n=1 Tax=Lachnellula suecica TaxID=602035 RepID=A0A8T9CEY2_9HELO|nr:SET domain-containing protein [Lachnellula suecica]